MWAAPKILYPSKDVEPVISLAEELRQKDLGNQPTILVFGNEWDPTLAYLTQIHTIHIPSSSNYRNIDYEKVTKSIKDLMGERALSGIVVCERWLSNYTTDEYAHYAAFFEFNSPKEGCEFNAIRN